MSETGGRICQGKPYVSKLKVCITNDKLCSVYLV